jgi:hypothetical protein
VKFCVYGVVMMHVWLCAVVSMKSEGVFENFFRFCVKCGSAMNLVAWDVGDELIWQCRRRLKGTRCNKRLSIRHGSWFDGSNLCLGEVLHICYMWVRGCSQVNGINIMLMN